MCTPGGAVLGIVGRGVTFRFLNGKAILGENMLFWVRLYAFIILYRKGKSLKDILVRAKL